jgi:hypothetical protein
MLIDSESCAQGPALEYLPSWIGCGFNSQDLTGSNRVDLKMKCPKSKLGLVLLCSYLLGAAVMINEFRCRPADWFLCGRSLGAVIVALPWTHPFLDGSGELYTLIAVLVAGVAVNAIILYMCGWAVERGWRTMRLP